MLNDVDSPDLSSQNSTSFAITCRELDERTSAVAVEGELDLTTAPRMKWMLLDSISAGRDLLVLDLTATTFMDSTALGVLVAIKRQLAPGAEMAIAAPNANVRRIFELSGMDGAFAILPSVEEALHHVGSSSAGPD